MGRFPRVVEPGGIYHVTSRGNSQQLIFVDEFDRHYFLKQLKATVDLFGWTCLQLCLLGNHFHLVVKVGEPNLSAGMHRLNWRYALYFNRKHGRTNHMVGDRFHDEHVADHAHFISLIAYLALNPVRAGLVERAEDWPWGSYGMIIGPFAPHSALAVGDFLAYVDVDPQRALTTVRALVEAELAAMRGAEGHGQKGHALVPVTGAWP